MAATTNPQPGRGKGHRQAKATADPKAAQPTQHYTALALYWNGPICTTANASCGSMENAPSTRPIGRQCSGSSTAGSGGTALSIAGGSCREAASSAAAAEGSAEGSADCQPGPRTSCTARRLARLLARRVERLLGRRVP
jgi:hypothetical protein